MKNKKVNLFIVGAPKCGTTSLAWHLSKHSDIYVPAIKEPHFWSTTYGGLKKLSGITSRSRYENLYLKRNEQILADCSTNYIYCDTASSAIKEYNPCAKYIIVLRNPYELVVSLHSQLLKTNFEDEADFSRALSLEDKRLTGKFIPCRCLEPNCLRYSDACRLGTHVSLFIKNLDVNQYRIFLLNDLSDNPNELYKEVLKFLKLDYESAGEIETLNESARYRSRTLGFIWQSALVRSFALSVKHRIGNKKNLEKLIKVKNLLLMSKLNNKTESVFFDPKFCAFVDSEIEILEKVISRDLSSWYSRYYER